MGMKPRKISYAEHLTAKVVESPFFLLWLGCMLVVLASTQLGR